MVAAKAGVEEAGEASFAQRQSGMLAQGFSFSGYERDGFYLNLGGGRFENVSGVSGIDALSDGRAALYADFDNDGDTDVFLTNIQEQAFALYRNNLGSDNNYLRISLTGSKSGKDAFGAVVRVGTSAGVLTKIKSGGSGYLSQHDARLLFGLGQDTEAQYVEVTWPDGTKQRFENVAGKQHVALVEGEKELKVIKDQKFQFPDPLTDEERMARSIHVKVGDKFPNLNVKLLDGQDATFPNAVNGPTVVNLWATWCVPCRKEMPELERLHKLGKMRVVGINLDDAAMVGKVKPHLRRMKISYENYTRGSQVLETIYAGDELFVPLTFVLDEKGVVTKIFSGAGADLHALFK